MVRTVILTRSAVIGILLGALVGVLLGGGIHILKWSLIVLSWSTALHPVMQLTGMLKALFIR